MSNDLRKNMEELEKQLDKCLEVRMEMFENQKELYRLICIAPVPKTKEEVDMLEEAINLYEKSNEIFQSTIESKKDIVKICRDNV